MEKGQRECATIIVCMVFFFKYESYYCCSLGTKTHEKVEKEFNSTRIVNFDLFISADDIHFATTWGKDSF